MDGWMDKWMDRLMNEEQEIKRGQRGSKVPKPHLVWGSATVPGVLNNCCRKRSSFVFSALCFLC